ncbi:MAG TPA: hypothetical protein IAC41_09510, partial [Candidatus Merdenecus merdavium]|nr:hypothetical protein [Candidatus Merdenecus merdavium]
MQMKEEVERFSPDYLAGLTKEQVEERKGQGLVNKVEQKITKTNGEIFR